MWNSSIGAVERAVRGLDRESRLRLRIFGFKLLIVIPVSLAFATQLGMSWLRALAFFCCWHAAFAGAAALVRRQSCHAGFLTAWDEMAGFFAIALLARLVGAGTE